MDWRDIKGENGPEEWRGEERLAEIGTVSTNGQFKMESRLK